jgi:chromate transporter
MRSRDILFLKDLFIIGFTAFGGPQAHIPVLQSVLVKKRNYLSNEELLELYSLCQFLPGPSSTQTVVAIALKRGGIPLAILALLMWVLPAAFLMSLLAVMFYGFQRYAEFPTSLFRFIQPAAIGIVAAAGIDMGQRYLNKYYLTFLIIIALISTAFIEGPWTFPFVLLLGGILSNFIEKNNTSPAVKYPLKWVQSSVSLMLFVFIFITAAVLGAITGFKPLVLFENFYRFGSITFGGGYVLTPMMFEQFVKHRQYLTGEEFLTGYAISQAMPGPSFAFASFAGGMALHALGYDYTLLGCLLGTIAIFLPGFLILLFVFPYWEFIKNYSFIKRAMVGINAVAAGIVLGAAVALYMDLEWSIYNPLVVFATFLLLKLTPLKAPHIIIGALFFGAVVMQLQ